MKIDRLLSIVIMLLNRDRIPASSLAKKFSVSVRTIYRDIEAINLAGIPIVSYSGNGGGLGIQESYTLDRQVLSLKDMGAILSALRSVSTAFTAGDVDMAREKVRSLVPQEKRNEVDVLQEQIVVDIMPWGYRAREKELLGDLYKAVQGARVVELAYRSYGGELTTRAVEPMTLVFKGSGWYLFGFCRTRKDFRLFRVSRIRRMAVKPEVFRRKAGGYEGYQAESSKLKSVKITLLCTRRSAEAFEDYLEPESIVAEGDRVRVTAQWPDDEWTYSMILGMGTNAEVIDPPGLRQEISRRARLVAGMYGN